MNKSLWKMGGVRGGKEAFLQKGSFPPRNLIPALLTPSARGSGGSVRLTKSNMLITLAPYFFPFYTFLVIIGALVTYAFFRPLPYLPLWLFLIGFTWSFHVLFTLETLGQRQPDVKLYGRIFSWTFIFIVNVAIVLVWQNVQELLGLTILM